MKDRPIFILSQARSGSTLVQRVLNQTPEVLIQGESFGLTTQLSDSFFNLTENKKERRWFLSGTDEAATIRDAEARLRNPKDFSATVCSLSHSRLLRIYRELFYELFNPTKRDLRWGFKEIRCCENGTFLVDLLLRMFPRAKIAFTVRHPVQQLSSKFATNWWPDETLDEAISTWDRQMTNFKSAAGYWTDNCRIWKYEDFTTPTGMAELISWLEITPTQQHRRTVFEVEKVGAAPCQLTFDQDALRRVTKGCWELHQDVYPLTS